MTLLGQLPILQLAGLQGDVAHYYDIEVLGGGGFAMSYEVPAPVDGVSEILVLHTLPSGAQPIAEGIDARGWPEIIGTIAGENTILIVCRSSEARVALAERLRTMAGQRGLKRG